MKIVKTLVIAIVAMLSVHAAEAQVSVRARIGSRPVHHRTVVVQRPVHRRVIVTRPAYRTHRVVTYRRYYANHRWYRRPVYHYRRY